MNFVPRSLSGRLLALSALTTLVALAFAAVAIGYVLERFVIQSLDQQLDAQAAMLARAVRDDGTLDPSRIVNLPEFESAGQGWGWRVVGPQGRWTGGDPIQEERLPDLAPPPRDGPMWTEHRPAPGEGRTPTGEHIHTRTQVVSTPEGEVTVVVGGPRRLAMAPLREAMVPLLGSLAILGVLLALASVVQLRYGLRPLRALQASVADVRAGRVRHVLSDQPLELAPLAAELNALVDQNEAQLAHARRHVANLAHGLKTPLAALSVKLAEGGHDPDGELRAMVANIDERVRHHLGRARAAAPGSEQKGHTSLTPAIDGLIAVMKGVHAERAIAVTCEIAPRLVIAADAQDVDEMLGNLLDNAWRHARSTVRVAATSTGRYVQVVIEDDGCGLSPAASQQALVPGRRLDERGDGHGFGLPITQELAELNGGTLSLDKAQLGGLRVALTLPGSQAGE